MYRRCLNIITIGLGEVATKAIREIEPQPSFSHEHVSTDVLIEDVAGRADLIIFDVSNLNALKQAARLVEVADSDADIILIADHSQIEELLQISGPITDIWVAPMSPAELKYRVTRLLEEMKLKTDAWLTDQYLEATINSIPNLIWYKSDDGIHHKVNDAFCKSVNKEKEDVQGQGHAYIWDVETDDPACIESERQVMETKSTIVSEESVRTGNGMRLLTTYKSPLYNYDGSTMGTVGVGIDITQERQYQESLVSSNRTLENILTSMQAGIITHSLDGSKIVSINDAALAILGFASKEELVESGFEMVASTVLSEDAEVMRAKMEQLKNVGDSINVEYRVRHDNGDILYVFGNVKLIENDGEVLFQRFLLDNTDRKLEEFQKEHQQHDLIQALSSDYQVVCSFNLDTGHGVPLRVKLTGHEDIESIFVGELDMRDVLDGYIEMRVFDDDRDLLRESLDPSHLIDCLGSENRLNVNYRASSDDKTLYCQVTAVRVGDWTTDDHEVVLGFRNVDAQTREDLRQRDLLEDALDQANKASAAKTTFLSSMSHDIRTPMNAIVGFTKLALNRLENPAAVCEYLGKINTSSSHLLNLINDILDMSRIESGKVSLDEQPCNLKDLITELGSIVQEEAKERGLRFSVDVDDVKEPLVFCDKLRLNQILLNLLGNSLKFTEPDGDIAVKLTELGSTKGEYGSYRFTIADSGIGMSSDFMEHIFEPFEREHTSTISGIQGTGLGMAITKNLVDMMGGTITVESEKGVGTTFTIELSFRLDKNDVGSCELEYQQHHLHHHSALRGARILLVDDNVFNREIAVELLEEEGFVVETANDGKEAVERLLEVGAGYYKLVLMDIQMPVMNGHEATRAIRAFENEDLASIPILAMTADAFEEDRQAALRAGMDGHLIKPIEMDKLLKALSGLLL